MKSTDFVIPIGNSYMVTDDKNPRNDGFMVDGKVIEDSTLSWQMKGLFVVISCKYLETREPVEVIHFKERGYLKALEVLEQKGLVVVKGAA